MISKKRNRSAAVDMDIVQEIAEFALSSAERNDQPFTPSDTSEEKITIVQTPHHAARYHL